MLVSRRPVFCYLIIALVVLFGAREGAAGNASSAAVARYEAALIQFSKDRDIKGVRAALLDVIKLDPTYAEPRFSLGVLAAAEEDWAEAIRWFEEVARLEQNSSMAAKAEKELLIAKRLAQSDKTADGMRRRRYDGRIQNGRALLNAGLYKEAFAEASVARELDQSRWEGYALAAAVLSEQRLFGDMLPIINDAIDRAPPAEQPKLRQAKELGERELQYDMHASSGAKALQMKDYAAASQEFSKAWQLFPKRGEYAIAAATASAMGGKYAEAAELYATVMELPDIASARKARELFGKLAIRVSNSPSPVGRTLNEKATTLLNGGRTEEAVAEYRKAVKLEPLNGVYRASLGVALLKLEHWSEALPQLQLAVLLKQRDVMTYRNLGIAYNRTEQYDLAFDAFGEAIKRDANQASLYQGRAIAATHLGRYQEATQDYSQAIQISESSGAYVGRGNVYVRLGDYQKAFADFQRASQLNPQDSNVWYARSWAYLLSGNNDDAARDAERYLESHSGNKGTSYATIVAFVAHRLAGRSSEGGRILSRTNPPGDDWPGPVVGFLRAEISEEKLVQMARTPARKTEAHSAIAVLARVDKHDTACRHQARWIRSEGDTTLLLAQLALKICQ